MTTVRMVSVVARVRVDSAEARSRSVVSAASSRGDGAQEEEEANEGEDSQREEV
jgi:hypothetical protein